MEQNRPTGALLMGDYGDGFIYQRGKRWWIGFSHDGKSYREPGGANNKGAKTPDEARKKLKARLKQAWGGNFIGPQEERVAVVDLLDDLVKHLELKGATSAKSVESHLRHVRATCSRTPARTMLRTCNCFVRIPPPAASGHAAAHHQKQPETDGIYGPRSSERPSNRAHNPKVGGSNPPPATILSTTYRHSRRAKVPIRPFCNRCVTLLIIVHAHHSETGVQRHLTA
jgi:hypothetical protein